MNLFISLHAFYRLKQGSVKIEDHNNSQTIRIGCDFTLRIDNGIISSRRDSPERHSRQDQEIAASSPGKLNAHCAHPHDALSVAEKVL